MKLSLKRVKSLCMVAILPLLLTPGYGQAEIYKYRGADGSYHFTDRPMGGRYKLVWRSGTTSRKKGKTYSWGTSCDMI